jgi:hypothetical protein
MDNKFSQLTDNFLFCHHKKLLKDDIGQVMRAIYDAGVCDETIANMFEERVSKHRFKQELNGTMPFDTPDHTNGDYIFGYDQNQQEIRSFIQFMNAHTLTIAGSGAGKTNLSRFKILQSATHVEGLWLFDLRKSEFVFLKPHLAKLGIHLLVIPARALRMNPLQLPVGVTIQNWSPRVADMLVQVLGLPPRASKLLQAKLFCLYQKFQPEKNIFPTLYDLFVLIKNDKGSNPQARMAFLDSLEPVLLSLGPKVLAYRYGWCSSELAKRHICFQLAGASETDKNLILNSPLLSELTSRIAQGISNPLMDLLINIDEAQRLCSSTEQSSAIADLIGLIRGSGIGLDLSLQGVNNLLPQVISNTSTKILGRCGNIMDYTTAGHSMGLNPDCIQWAQMNLTRGTFIGQFGEGSLRHPFVFSVPLINCPKLAADEQFDIGSLSNLPVVYASEFDNWGFTPEVGVTTTTKLSIFDSEQEFSFCKAVADNPMQASSVYPKLAGISSKTAANVRQKLVSKGLIKEHVLGTRDRGRSSILLETLPAGIQAVQKYEED